MHYTRQELMDAAADFESKPHTVQNLEKLITIYNALDQMFPGWKQETIPAVSAGYSNDSGDFKKEESATVGKYGDSDFLRAIYGKNAKEAWKLMDEVMETLSVVDRRFYNSILNRI